MLDGVFFYQKMSSVQIQNQNDFIYLSAFLNRTKSFDVTRMS